jgi:hypothetical protein
VKFLKRLKRFDFYFAFFLVCFAASTVAIAYPLFLGPQSNVFVDFLLLYNFTILLVLIYREQRKNLK